MSNATSDYRLQAFDAQSPSPARDLANLHGQLLPHSPVVLLGPRFMERFYYALLPRADLVFGAVAYWRNQPAGFIVATDDSSGFMGRGIRRHWLRLGWILGTSLLMQPKRIVSVWEAGQIMRHLQPTVLGSRVGELLSFGVLPDYRNRAFLARTGISMARDLLEAALAALRNRGIATVRVIVDDDNLEAKLFYHGLGWELTAQGVPGWKKLTVEFVKQLDESGDR
jgi:ribosomal protein S18 acetylase RimI-like enzyme